MPNELSRQPVVRAIAAAFGTFYILGAVVVFDFGQTVGLFIGGSSALIIILYPARRGQIKTKPTVLDALLVLTVTAPSVYFAVFAEQLSRNAGMSQDYEVLLGSMIVIGVLEVARRVLGPILPSLAGLLLAYNYLGPWLPGPLNHMGFSPARIIMSSFHGSGVFGLVASTYARYVILFVVFGALIARLGMADVLMELSIKATRRLRAGPGKAAILASAGIGSVIGSGVANIAITAPLTIPMLRSTGLSREKSGGLEVAASVGGMLLPPVMGAGAFIMAQMVGVPYSQVVTAALVPALLYYVALLASVHFETQGTDVDAPETVPDPASSPSEDVDSSEGVDEVPADSALPIGRRMWTFIPLAMLIVLLIVVRMNAFRAAFWSIVACSLLFLVLGRGSPLYAIRQSVEGITDGALDTLPVASTAGVVGIVLAMLHMSGLPITLSRSAFSLVGTSLVLAFLIVVVISLILGMGLTIVAAYVIVAIMAVPLFQQLGVDPLVGHMIVFWLSVDSTITPPFAVGTFVVQSFSKGSLWRTAMYALAYAKPLYIVPFLMLYTPIVTGSFVQRMASGIQIGLGLILLSSVIAGRFRTKSSRPTRGMLGAAAAALLHPQVWSSAVGAVIALSVWFWQHSRESRRQAGPGGDAPVSGARMLTPDQQFRSDS